MLQPISQIEELIERLKVHVSEGSKAFWVCPLLEPSQALPSSSAKERYEQLLTEFPSQVCLLHGAMSSEDKNRVMSEFSEGRGGVLVSTTVVEVGVNVPDASICVIERAERFGLAQIHQIRGRIGRGDPPPTETLSHCLCVLLHSDINADGDPGDGSNNPAEKLGILLRSNDGFEIAEFDWNYRREGDIFGVLQHGAFSYKAFTVNDHSHLFKDARKTAEALLREDWSHREGDAMLGKSLVQALFNTPTESSLKVCPPPASRESKRSTAPRSKGSSAAETLAFKYLDPVLIDLDLCCVIAFDLETTGLCKKTNRIIQIAAKVVGDDTVFNRYILPKDDQVSDFIESLTGISQSFVEEEGISLENALNDFVLWLQRVGSRKPLILVAHNGRRFDVPFLAVEFSRISNFTWIQDSNIIGFVDSYMVLKNVEAWTEFDCIPTSMRQESLYQFVTGKSAFNAHNAIADVSCLEEILEDDRLKHTWRIMARQNTFSFEYLS